MSSKLIKKTLNIPGFAYHSGKARRRQNIANVGRYVKSTMGKKKNTMKNCWQSVGWYKLFVGNLTIPFDLTL